MCMASLDNLGSEMKICFFLYSCVQCLRVVQNHYPKISKKITAPFSEHPNKAFPNMQVSWCEPIK